jgi:SAM-dependent methyltransferase
MTPGEQWLAATWQVIRTRLPQAPARVVDVGCGPLGGFVPMLLSEAYDAIGIDPAAPDEPHYQRIEFERAQLPDQVDAVVASTSLHHVTNPADVIDRIASMLRSGGAVLVVEWAWEDFDEQTAEWCFRRLPSGDDAGWLNHRRDEWLASGERWSSYLRNWAEGEGLHSSETIVGVLDERLERRLLTHGAYFFPDLAGTTEADEQDAIAAGRIRATRIDYAGRFG